MGTLVSKAEMPLIGSTGVSTQAVRCQVRNQLRQDGYASIHSVESGETPRNGSTEGMGIFIGREGAMLVVH